ncbi:hypothetical protein MWU54_11325 [Marivita sp. S6314]|uniref:hypothetical protein n=1 Tax=Marivita sp. S6314 TaxID=2926406 RepID=UPI001FF60B67|nr:hypothetical protein [Marivita sp. S6314]MCK0150619.1 hypothetical protein [Marivita sp. S6314]
MEMDTLFVIGLVLGVLSVPAIVSAISNGQRPRIATITLMIAGGLVVYAMSKKPGGYSFDEIPGIVARVLSSFT